eukprot:TRINITY_DN10994_c0_g1_i1.p1 TRINITY_DN10994_c0_g1~~TRINITY_DN10994_c0_g1_i1.p1  ORF type:complete len:445 (+),score=100.08 TRINITY_DN10994_c0_g1_i1:29-1336(+)
MPKHPKPPSPYSPDLVRFEYPSADCCVMVTNLSANTSGKDLENLFRSVDYVLEARIFPDPNTSRSSTGFGVVRYCSPQSAKKAAHILDGAVIHDCPCKTATMKPQGKAYRKALPFYRSTELLNHYLGFNGWTSTLREMELVNHETLPISREHVFEFVCLVEFVFQRINNTLVGEDGWQGWKESFPSVGASDPKDLSSHSGGWDTCSQISLTQLHQQQYENSSHLNLRGKENPSQIAGSLIQPISTQSNEVSVGIKAEGAWIAEEKIGACEEGNQTIIMNDAFGILEPRVDVKHESTQLRGKDDANKDNQDEEDDEESNEDEDADDASESDSETDGYEMGVTRDGLDTSAASDEIGHESLLVENSTFARHQLALGSRIVRGFGRGWGRDKDKRSALEVARKEALKHARQHALRQISLVVLPDGRNFVQRIAMEDEE